MSTIPKIVEELNALAEEQGESVSQINRDMRGAHLDTEKAYKELKKAVPKEQCNTRLLVCTLLVLAFVCLGISRSW